MKTGVLWNEVVTRLHKERYSDVTLHHILADNCAMQLVRAPKQFDVIVTDNLFGDMLSDEASMLTGSLGMLPSASLGAADAMGAAARSTSRCTARRRTSPGAASPTPSPPSRASPWLALFLQSGGDGGPNRKGHRFRARRGLPHRRYRARELPHHRHRRDGQRHHRRPRPHVRMTGWLQRKENPSPEGRVARRDLIAAHRVGASPRWTVPTAPTIVRRPLS